MCRIFARLSLYPRHLISSQYYETHPFQQNLILFPQSVQLQWHPQKYYPQIDAFLLPPHWSFFCSSLELSHQPLMLITFYIIALPRHCPWNCPSIYFSQSHITCVLSSTTASLPYHVLLFGTTSVPPTRQTLCSYVSQFSHTFNYPSCDPLSSPPIHYTITLLYSSHCTTTSLNSGSHLICVPLHHCPRPPSYVLLLCTTTYPQTSPQPPFFSTPNLSFLRILPLRTSSPHSRNNPHFPHLHTVADLKWTVSTLPHTHTPPPPPSTSSKDYHHTLSHLPLVQSRFCTRLIRTVYAATPSSSPYRLAQFFVPSNVPPKVPPTWRHNTPLPSHFLFLSPHWPSYPPHWNYVLLMTYTTV